MDRKKVLRLAGLAVLGAVLLFLGIKVALPLLLPFLVAFLLAAATEKPAGWLTKTAQLPRAVAGSLCVLSAYALFFAALFLLGRAAVGELGKLLSSFPQWMERLGPVLQRVRGALQNYIARLPEGLSQTVTDATDRFFKNGAGLFEALPGRIGSLVANFVGKLPDIFLFLVTTLISSFMMAANLPQLRKFLSRVLPKNWRGWVTRLWHRSGETLKAWLTAELKLSGITFLLVTLGLVLLRASSPLLLGFIIALVDLLPVFGTGTILLPWALGCLLQGNFSRGIALALLYGAAAITKSSLEPRFLGKQMGLPPLLTLAAVYIGYRSAGFWGLLLFPMTAAIAVQVWKLIKKEEESR